MKTLLIKIDLKDNFFPSFTQSLRYYELEFDKKKITQNLRAISIFIIFEIKIHIH